MADTIKVKMTTLAPNPLDHMEFVIRDADGVLRPDDTGKLKFSKKPKHNEVIDVSPETGEYLVAIGWAERVGK